VLSPIRLLEVNWLVTRPTKSKIQEVLNQCVSWGMNHRLAEGIPFLKYSLILIRSNQRVGPTKKRGWMAGAGKHFLVLNFLVLFVSKTKRTREQERDKA
jgi:hypothetical protein